MNVLSLIKRITMMERREGEYLPPWYFGLVYKDWTRPVMIFMIMPFNYIWRIGRLLRVLWDTMRSRPSYIDKQILKRFHNERSR